MSWHLVLIVASVALVVYGWLKAVAFVLGEAVCCGEVRTARAWRSYVLETQRRAQRRGCSTEVFDLLEAMVDDASSAADRLQDRSVVLRCAVRVEAWSRKRRGVEKENEEVTR